MKNLAGCVAVALGVAASTPAFAEGAFSGKVGILLGPYSYTSKYTDQGCGCVTPDDQFDETDFDVGLNGGLTLAVSRWFADVGVEVLGFAEGDDLDGDGSDDSTYRTDTLLTTGVYLGDHWVLFGGYRNTDYGDGVFSNTGGYIQRGPFLGAGFSFKMGSRVATGLSLAYNTLTYETESGLKIEDLDLNGFSGKVQMNILQTPHSLYLRWQHFAGEIDYPAFGYGFEFTEDYVNFGYQLTFDFTTW